MVGTGILEQIGLHAPVECGTRSQRESDGDRPGSDMPPVQLLAVADP